MSIHVAESITIIVGRFGHCLLHTKLMPHPDAQLVFKCASVLGTIFSCAMLATIMPNLTEPVFNCTIASLAFHGSASMLHRSVIRVAAQNNWLRMCIVPAFYIASNIPSHQQPRSIQWAAPTTLRCSPVSVSCWRLCTLHAEHSVWLVDQQTMQGSARESGTVLGVSGTLMQELWGNFTLLGTTDTKPTRRQSLSHKEGQAHPQEQQFRGIARDT